MAYSPYPKQHAQNFADKLMGNKKIAQKFKISFYGLVIMMVLMFVLGNVNSVTLANNGSEIYTKGLIVEETSDLIALLQRQRVIYRDALITGVASDITELNEKFGLPIEKALDPDPELEAIEAQLYTVMDDADKHDLYIELIAERQNLYEVRRAEALDRVTSEVEKLSDCDAEFHRIIKSLKQNDLTTEESKLVTVIDDYYECWTHDRDLMTDLIINGDAIKVLSRITDSEGTVESLIEMAKQLNTTSLEDAKAANTMNHTMKVWMLVVMSLVGIVSIVLGLWSASYYIKSIGSSVRNLSLAADSIARGNVNINVDTSSKDELGDLARSFEKMSYTIGQQAAALNQMSSGNYTIKYTPVSSEDTVGNAISTILRDTTRVMQEIKTSVMHLSGGAEQVAHSADSIAQSNSEQSSSIDNMVESVRTLSSQSNKVSESAQHSLDGVTEVETMMKDCLETMNSLSRAMTQINESSGKISQVINVIDDIAFQTNILALNAAVEAARAGQAGKGFAVVADEVRNLAHKSSAAAQETSALIETSIKCVSDGNKAMKEAQDRIVTTAQLASKTMTSTQEISSLASGQASSISEVRDGISEISSVVQSNTAVSEESAAASMAISEQIREVMKSLDYFRT